MSILKRDSHEIDHIKSKHQSDDYFIGRVTIGKKMAITLSLFALSDELPPLGTPLCKNVLPPSIEFIP